MSVERTIAEAIRARRELTLRYGGDGGEPRRVQPHALCRAASGSLWVDAYQLAGPSRSGGPLPEWRRFQLARIDSVELRDVAFAPAPGYDREAPIYRTGVLAAIDP